MFFKWGALSAGFFGGSYALRAYRGREDAINYMISGSVNMGIYQAVKRGPKFGAGAVILGGIWGGTYKWLADASFESAKEAWISLRRNSLTGKSKLIKFRKVNPFQRPDEVEGSGGGAPLSHDQQSIPQITAADAAAVQKQPSK